MSYATKQAIGRKTNKQKEPIVDLDSHFCAAQFWGGRGRCLMGLPATYKEPQEIMGGGTWENMSTSLMAKIWKSHYWHCRILQNPRPSLISLMVLSVSEVKKLMAVSCSSFEHWRETEVLQLGFPHWRWANGTWEPDGCSYWKLGESDLGVGVGSIRAICPGSQGE